MKIFMSHSSRQKLFVKELRRHLPNSVALWIDERELRLGSNIDSELESAVREDCDFFILVVDSYSNQSEWVQKEISWALDREQELGQNFLLPILVEPEAWKHADPRIQDRKYLSLSDFTDENIAAVGRSLTSEIFDWLSIRLSNESALSPGELESRSNAELLRSADQLTAGVAEAVKSAVLPYRATNPIALHDLLLHLRSRNGLDIPSDEGLLDVLERLNSMHLLNGVEFDEEFVFLSRENFSFKANLHTSIKKKMARVAAAEIQSGDTIAIDGGSSVLALVQILIRRLRLGSLQDLNVITNSIPAAGQIVEALSDLGSTDRGRLARVFLLGGYARPVSLTTVPYEYATNLSLSHNPLDEYDRVLQITGPIDICYLGANGIYENHSLGTRNPYETAAKSWMVQNSNRKFVLMDSSKLLIRQQVPFASFDDQLQIITAFSQEDAASIEVFSGFVASTRSHFQVVS